MCVCVTKYVCTCGNMCVHAKLLQSYLTLCDSMDCGPPGLTVHGILQAGILEWIAVSSSRGSSRPRRDWTCCLLHLLHWQADSWPLAPPGKVLTVVKSGWGLYEHLSHYFFNFSIVSKVSKICNINRKQTKQRASLTSYWHDSYPWMLLWQKAILSNLIENIYI